MTNLPNLNPQLSKALQAVLDAVRPRQSPLMIFGSFARGDASASSDVDVLELTDKRSRPYVVGRAHVYPYTDQRLRTMAESGALFVLHLRKEGLVFRDPNGALAQLLDSYSPPVSYDPYRLALRSAANLLDTSYERYSTRWKAYNDLAIFILRTTLYIHFVEMGDPVFSLAEIARRLQRNELKAALSLKSASTPDFDLFKSTGVYVSELLGTKIHNPFGSVEAFITNEGVRNPAVTVFGLRLLGNENPGMGYDLLTSSPLG